MKNVLIIIWDVDVMYEQMHVINANNGYSLSLSNQHKLLETTATKIMREMCKYGISLHQHLHTCIL